MVQATRSFAVASPAALAATPTAASAPSASAFARSRSPPPLRRPPFRPPPLPPPPVPGVTSPNSVAAAPPAHAARAAPLLPVARAAPQPPAQQAAPSILLDHSAVDRQQKPDAAVCILNAVEDTSSPLPPPPRTTRSMNALVGDHNSTSLLQVLYSISAIRLHWLR